MLLALMTNTEEANRNYLFSVYFTQLPIHSILENIKDNEEKRRNAVSGTQKSSNSNINNHETLCRMDPRFIGWPLDKSCKVND